MSFLLALLPIPFSLPRHQSRARLALFGALATLALTLTNATTAHSQANRAGGFDFRGRWTWEGMRRIPDVDTSRISWLQQNVPMAEARELFALVAALSKPELAQILPAYRFIDNSRTWRSGRAIMDTLAMRGPGGDVGRVRLAYLLAQLRRQTLDGVRTSVYRATFDSTPMSLPPQITAGGAIPRGFRLSFDFGPMDTLLAIVTTPNITPAAVMPRISTHPFDALIGHHSQSFYPLPLSRELLALNLSHAASTQPLDRLYAYAVPNGLLHYTDLRTNVAEYRRMTSLLKRHERDILAYVARDIARYVPADTRLTRRVSFYVADWADGWGASDITAVDLEYYKSDLPRLINVLLHETFHAAQGAVAAAHPSRRPAPRTIADSMLASAAQFILVEGTANFVAPATNRTPESAAAMVDSGTALLARLAALAGASGTYDRTAAQSILDVGVSGGGPFYWLGAAMARVHVEREGAQSIGKLLSNDGLDFLRSYARLSGGANGRPSLLPPGIVALLSDGQ